MSKKSDKPRSQFAELIDKLKAADDKVIAWEEELNKLTTDDKTPVADKISAFMEKYNAAILSFVNLGSECERIVKAQKAAMWRKKDYFVKTISK